MVEVYCILNGARKAGLLSPSGKEGFVVRQPNEEFGCVHVCASYSQLFSWLLSFKCSPHTPWHLSHDEDIFIGKAYLPDDTMAPTYKDSQTLDKTSGAMCSLAESSKLHGLVDIRLGPVEFETFVVPENADVLYNVEYYRASPEDIEYYEDVKYRSHIAMEKGLVKAEMPLLIEGACTQILPTMEVPEDASLSFTPLIWGMALDHSTKWEDGSYMEYNYRISKVFIETIDNVARGADIDLPLGKIEQIKVLGGLVKKYKEEIPWDSDIMGAEEGAFLFARWLRDKNYTIIDWVKEVGMTHHLEA